MPLKRPVSWVGERLFCFTPVPLQIWRERRGEKTHRITHIIPVPSILRVSCFCVDTVHSQFTRFTA